MNIRRVIVVFIYSIFVLVSFVVGDKESNKRMPGGTHAFQQMVRYGRSSNKDGRIRVYPRTDVFYLGPRYGKRSRTSTSPLDNLKIDTAVNDRSIPCIYTGVTNLYRCNTSGRSTQKQLRI